MLLLLLRRSHDRLPFPQPHTAAPRSPPVACAGQVEGYGYFQLHRDMLSGSAASLGRYRHPLQQPQPPPMQPPGPRPQTGPQALAGAGPGLHAQAQEEEEEALPGPGAGSSAAAAAAAAARALAPGDGGGRQLGSFPLSQQQQQQQQQQPQHWRPRRSSWSMEELTNALGADAAARLEQPRVRYHADGTPFYPTVRQGSLPPASQVRVRSREGEPLRGLVGRAGRLPARPCVCRRTYTRAESRLHMHPTECSLRRHPPRLPHLAAYQVGIPYA